jgi:hypothetical protein
MGPPRGLARAPGARRRPRPRRPRVIRLLPELQLPRPTGSCRRRQGRSRSIGARPRGTGGLLRPPPLARVRRAASGVWEGHDGRSAAPPGGGATGCRLERCEVLPFEPQGLRQLPHGGGVRAPPLSSFQQADGLRGEACPFRQILLGNVGRDTVMPKQIPEREPVSCVQLFRLLAAGRPGCRRHRNTASLGPLFGLLFGFGPTKARTSG